MVTLTTERLLLAPPEASDVTPLYRNLRAGRITDTIVWDGPRSRGEYSQALRQFRRSHRRGKPENWVIRLLTDRQPIGCISLRRELPAGRANLGYWLAEPMQGQGYMTEAAAELVRWGFEQQQLEKIEAAVFLGNVASRRVLEKIGLVCEGTIRKRIYKRGSWVDEWLMGITREDFRGRQQGNGLVS